MTDQEKEGLGFTFACVINAPVETVFTAITDQHAISTYFTDASSGPLATWRYCPLAFRRPRDRRPGPGSHPQSSRIVCNWPAAGKVDYRTTFTFTFQSRGDSTVIQVRETGWLPRRPPAWPAPSTNAQAGPTSSPASKPASNTTSTSNTSTLYVDKDLPNPSRYTDPTKMWPRLRVGWPRLRAAWDPAALPAFQPPPSPATARIVPRPVLSLPKPPAPHRFPSYITKSLLSPTNLNAPFCPNPCHLLPDSVHCRSKLFQFPPQCPSPGSPG